MLNKKVLLIVLVIFAISCGTKRCAKFDGDRDYKAKYNKNGLIKK